MLAILGYDSKIVGSGENQHKYWRIKPTQELIEWLENNNKHW